MDSPTSGNNSIHLSSLKLSSFEDSELDNPDFTVASVSQLSESLFKFITPQKKDQIFQQKESSSLTTDPGHQLRVDLSGKFEALAVDTHAAEDAESSSANNRFGNSAVEPKDTVETVRAIINEERVLSTVDPVSDIVDQGSVGFSDSSAVQLPVNTVSDSENRSKVSPVAVYTPITLTTDKVHSVHTSRIEDPSTRNNISDMEKELHELRKFHDSLTGGRLQSTAASKLKTPHSTASGFNNLSGLRSVSEQMDFDEEKDKREHYETLSVKLQGRVLELEEQLALANASNIRKDRTVQELRQKLQTVIKKLDEVSKETVKESEALREERDTLEAQLSSEKEKSRELESRFKEVLKIAESLKEKYHDSESLSRTLNLELTDLRTNHKSLQRDCTVLDEENRRLLNSVNDVQNDFVKVKVDNEKLSSDVEEKANTIKALRDEMNNLKVRLEEVKIKLAGTDDELLKAKRENKVLTSQLERLRSEKEEQKRLFDARETALQQQFERTDDECRRKIEECRRECNERTNQLRSHLAEESELKLQSLVVSFEEQLNQLKQKKAEETAALKSQNSSEVSKYKSQLAERDAQIAKMKQYNSYLSDHCKSMMQFQLMYFNASNGGRDMDGVTAMPMMTQFNPTLFPTKSDWKSDARLKTGFDEFVFNLDKAQRSEQERSGKAVCVSSPQRSDDHNSVGEDSSGTVISSFNASSVKIYYPPVRELASASKPELKGLVEQVLKRQPSAPIPAMPSGTGRMQARSSAPDSTWRKTSVTKTPQPTKKR